MTNDVPTIVAITDYLENGTGTPNCGLRFQLEDEATILELMTTDDYANWALWPVDVYNSVDGWHEDCVVLVNITNHGVFRFLAMDPKGQPVAYHEATR